MGGLYAGQFPNISHRGYRLNSPRQVYLNAKFGRWRNPLGHQKETIGVVHRTTSSYSASYVFLGMLGSELPVRNIEHHAMEPDNRAMGRILSTTVSVDIKLPTLQITPSPCHP